MLAFRYAYGIIVTVLAYDFFKIKMLNWLLYKVHLTQAAVNTVKILLKFKLGHELNRLLDLS